VTDVARVGDTMLVKVIHVDDQDRVKLSRKAAMAERGLTDPFAGNPMPERPPGAGGGRDRERGDRDRDRDRDRRGGGGGGGRPPR
jgi:polyribonucleotide nucleotidyltransferase